MAHQISDGTLLKSGHNLLGVGGNRQIVCVLVATLPFVLCVVPLGSRARVEPRFTREGQFRGVWSMTGVRL